MSEMRTIVTERIQTGPLMVNTYVVYAQGADSCVVIDPADDAPIKKYAETYGLKIAAVLLTHCHFDHILGVPGLVQDGAKLYIGENDAAGLNDRSVSLCFMELPEMKPDALLKDGDIITEAGLTIKVIATPGHTAGGVCYVLEETSVIFSGDTLFRFSIGRTDFPGGDYATLISSIKNKLFALEGDYAVNPGHDISTTLDEEKQRNPYAGRGARW